MKPARVSRPASLAADGIDLQELFERNTANPYLLVEAAARDSLVPRRLERNAAPASQQSAPVASGRSRCDVSLAKCNPGEIGNVLSRVWVIKVETHLFAEVGEVALDENEVGMGDQ